MTKQTNDINANAANNAQIAAKTAADSAIVISTVANDVGWMKQSLAKIEQKLDQMDKAFVTAAQHAEVLKRLDDQQTQIEDLKTERTRVAVLLSIGIGILTLLVSLLTWHLMGR